MADFSKRNKERDLYITTAFSTLSTGEGEVTRLIGDALIAHVSLCQSCLYSDSISYAECKCRQRGVEFATCTISKSISYTFLATVKLLNLESER